ncbi:MAG: GNAT family N-acetyltransferase, partial [Acidimicrobiales bacterium]
MIPGRVVSPADVDAAAIGAWRDLATRAAEPNPLFEAECVVPAAAHLGNGPAIRLVVAPEGAAMLGCLPVQRAEGFRAIRRPVVTTQIRRMSYDGTPLLDGERADEAAAALLAVLGERSRRGEPGLLVLDWLDAGGPVFAAFEAAAARLGMPWYVYHRWVRPVVEVAAHPEPARERLTGDFSRSLRRRQRLLHQEMGDDVRLFDRGGDPSAVEALIRMEAAGYKAEIGVAMTGHRGEDDWFRAMCDGFRAERRLHVFTLEAPDGTVLAVQLSVTGGDTLFQLKTGYDERYGRFSPGLQLQLDVMDHVARSIEVARIDSCTYEGNETLLRICPERREVADVVVAVGGRRHRAYLQTLAGARVLAGRGGRARRRHRRLDAVLDRIEPVA